MEIKSPEKRLYRSRTDKMIAGVCGGIGEYLEVDPTLVRLAFVLLAVLGNGSGLILYIVLALLVPQVPAERGEPDTGPQIPGVVAAPPGVQEPALTAASEGKEAGLAEVEEKVFETG